MTYDTNSEKFVVDSDATEVHFPEGLCWDDEAAHWTDEPLLVEDVVQRLAVQLSSPAPLTAFGASDSVSISTKFIELALNILDPDFKWDAEEPLEASDAASRFLMEYPITDWEIEGAFGLVVQFVHDWATGDYHDSVVTNEAASVFIPTSDHDLDVLEFGIDVDPHSNEKIHARTKGFVMTISKSIEVEENESHSESHRVDLAICVTLSLAEAAEILGIHRTTAWSLHKRGAFPVPVLQVGSNLRVLKSHLQLFMETGEPVKPGTRFIASKPIAS